MGQRFDGGRVRWIEERHESAEDKVLLVARSELALPRADTLPRDRQDMESVAAQSIVGLLGATPDRIRKKCRAVSLLDTGAERQHALGRALGDDIAPVRAVRQYADAAAFEIE